MFAFILQTAKRMQRAGWAMADQAIVSASNFVTMFLLARYMDVASFGIFVLAYTGLRLATSFQHTVITEPHNSLAAKLSGREYRSFTSVLILVQAVFALGWFALLAVAGGVLYVTGLPEHGLVTVALGVMLIPWMGQEFVRRILYTKHDSKAATINDTVSYGAQAGSIVVFVLLYDEPTVLHGLMAYGVSSLVATILGAWQIREHILFERTVFDRQRIREVVDRIWEFGKWLTGGNLVKWFGDNGNTWLVGALIGAAPLGALQAAAQIANLLNPLIQAVTTYLPSVASAIMEKDGKAGLRKLLRKLMVWLAIPFSVVTVAVMLAAEPLLKLAYGDKFLNQGLEWIIVLVAFTYILSLIKAFLRMVFMAMEVSRPLFIASVISSFLLATTGLTLIYYVGIWGAPMSSGLMSLVTIGYFWTVYRRLMDEAEDASEGRLPAADQKGATPVVSGKQSLAPAGASPAVP